MGLWDVKPRPPPNANAPPKALEIRIDYSDSQLPEPARRLFGGSDNYLCVDSQYPEVYSP